jgi:hypothetical protein
MKSQEVKEFINENCPDCHERCEWGIRENYRAVWCVDTGIIKMKKSIENQEEHNV